MANVIQHGKLLIWFPVLIENHWRSKEL